MVTGTIRNTRRDVDDWTEAMRHSARSRLASDGRPNQLCHGDVPGRTLPLAHREDGRAWVTPAMQRLSGEVHGNPQAATIHNLLLQGILGTQRLDARDLVLVTPCACNVAMTKGGYS